MSAMRLIAAALVSCLLGCSNFEEPELVIDLRTLGMTMTPPEVLADVDLEAETPAEGFDFTELLDVEVCALVADPTSSRRLSYRMTACAPTRSRRCDEPDDDSAFTVEFAEGSVDDPEIGADVAVMCGTLFADGNLLPILNDSVSADSLLGFGGIGVQVELRVEAQSPDAPVIYANKTMRYAGRIPIDRVPNNNPTIDGITVVLEDGSEEMMPFGRCADIEPFPVPAGTEIEVDVIEPEGVREDYVLPTLDGERVEITENLSYTWFSTAGDWSKFRTGGPEDSFGNVPLTRTHWRSPPVVEVEGDLEVWMVQYDERGGVSWYQSCIRVVP